MIDLTREPPIPLAQVPKLAWLRKHREQLGLAEKGTTSRLHCSTVFRWASRGLRGQRLEYVQLGGTRVTTEAALLRFFAALSGDNASVNTANIKRNNVRDRVERELDNAGL